MMSFSPTRLTTIYPNKAAHYIPKGVKLAERLLKQKRRREREGESEEGEKVIWC